MFGNPLQRELDQRTVEVNGLKDRLARLDEQIAIASERAHEQAKARTAAEIGFTRAVGSLSEQIATREAELAAIEQRATEDAAAAQAIQDAAKQLVALLAVPALQTPAQEPEPAEAGVVAEEEACPQGHFRDWRGAFKGWEFQVHPHTGRMEFHPPSEFAQQDHWVIAPSAEVVAE